MYVFDLSKIRPGDIILQRYDGDPYSKKICQKSGSHYSHAMLYVGQSSVIEAGDTVEANNLGRVLVENPESVAVMRIKPEYLNDDVIGEAIMYAREVVGMAYSKKEAIRVLNKPQETVSPNRQICTRLVAQSFSKAGFDIVDNPDYCTVKEFEENKCLFRLEDCLKPATQEDIDYANSYNVLKDQADFTKDVLEKASKLLHEDVQTIEQLSNMACKYPEKAEELCSIVRESGYLELWKLEKESHPYEYDASLFVAHYSGNVEDAASQIINTNEELIKVYEQNLSFMYMGCTLYGNNAYLLMMADLYKTLIGLCDERNMVATEALRKIADGQKSNRFVYDSPEDNE